MAYARDIGSGIDLVGGLIQQGAQTQDYINGLFDQHAQKKAGEAVARGDYDTASGLLGARGKIDAAETLRGRSTDRRVLKAIDTGDFDTARSEAANAGDSGAYGAATSAEDQEKKERASWLGHAADALLQIPDEAARKEAFASSIAPVMKSMGVGDEMIAQIGAGSLDDNNLKAFKASLGQVADLEIQKMDDGTVLGIDKKSGSVSVLHEGERKGVVVDNNVVDPVSGEVIYKGRNLQKLSEGETLVDPDGGGGGGVGEGGGEAPRNLRNNNPGNIEDGDFAKSLPGYAGTDGRFAKFDSMENGSAAQVALLGSYGRRGIDTVEGIINRWAPPSDNNPTDAYAKFVANKVGVKPGQKLDMTDKATLSDIAAAIQEFEGGGSSGSSGPTVLAQGKEKPKRSYVDATPAELRKAGYPPGTRAQKDNETGKFENIKQPNESAVKAAGYMNRVLGANDRMNALAEKRIYKPDTVTSQLFDGSGESMRIVTKTEKDRLFVQAAKEWLAPVLRKDTGAAVTNQELATYMEIYIPKYEDSIAVLRNKAQARMDVMRSLGGEAGNVFGETYGNRKYKVLAPKAPGPTQQAGGSAKGASGKVVKIEVVG